MPYTDIISLERAKTYLRIDDTLTADDSEIEAMIEGALQFIETYTNHILIPREFTAYSRCGSVEVYNYPVTSFDDEDAEVLLYPLKTVYKTELSSITYTAGYAEVSAIPKGLIQAALQIIKVWYYESEKEVNETMLPVSVRQVIDSYRRFV